MRESYDMYRILFDTLPIPVFVMDADMVIQTSNAAGNALYTSDSPVVRRRCGEVIHCLNERTSSNRCGETDSCPDCLVRTTVLTALEGETIIRRRAEMLIAGDNGESKRKTLLVTAAKIPGEPLAVAVLEDFTELTVIRDIIPICSNCRKVRTDSEYLHHVDEYLARFGGMHFSHGVCPECIKILYPDMKDWTEPPE